MASNIKGLIIEIGGDTSGLKKSLNEATKSVSSLQTELTKINKALKINPTSFTLASQKSKVLKEDISATKDKLNALKAVQKAATQEIKNGGEISAEKYRAVQREIIETKTKLNSLKSELKESGTAGFLDAVEEKIKDIGGKISSFGSSITSKVTAPIVAIGTLGVTYNAEMQKYTQQLKTMLGSTEAAQETLAKIKEDAARTPFDTAGLTQANSFLMSTGETADESRKTILALGDAVSATGGGSDELTRMAQNLQQIKQVGKATSADVKQFAMAGIDVYGILSDYTGKTTAELQDMDITYEMISGALQKAASEGGKYYGAMEAQSQIINGKISTLKDTIMEMVGSLTESLVPIVTKVIEKIKTIVDKFNSLDAGTKERIVKIAAIVAAIGPVIMIIGKIITLIGTLTQVMSFLAANPVILIIAAIAALVAGFIYLWNNCESFRNFWINLWTSIKDFVSNAINGIISVFNFVVDFITNNWQGLLLFLVNPFIGGFKLLYDNCEGFRNFVDNFVAAIKEKFNAGINWIVNLFTEKIPNLVTKIINWFKELPSKLIEIGKDAIQGLLNGFTSAGNIIYEAIKSVGNSMLDGIKSFFGIASPSRLLRDEVGKFLPSGVAVGITANTDSALKAVDKFNNSILKEMSSDISVGSFSNMTQLESSNNTSISESSLKSIIMEAINSVDWSIYIDKDKFGDIATDSVNNRLGRVW